MSSTFKFHSGINEIVPWQAQYTFPTQSTKIAKQTVKLVPKNGTEFSRQNIIRIEFPAENYLNVLNSVLQFDVTLNAPSTVATGTFSSPTTTAAGIQYTVHTGVVIAGKSTFSGHPISIVSGGVEYWNVIESWVYLTTTTAVIQFARPWPISDISSATYSIYPQVAMQQGGAHCHFSRLRVLYGSLVLEDIQEYHTLVRLLYECAVQRDYSSAQGQILDGMSGYSPNDIGASADSAGLGMRQTYKTASGAAVAQSLYMPGQTRTFCINLLSGLLTQKKLIPLKWMASQLCIELTVSNELDALIGSGGNTAAAGALAAAPTSLTYQLSNVNFIAELLEFDSAFDTAFWRGLESMGVPLKFSSWHFHTFPIAGSNQTFQIHERSRSVKSAFAVARSTQAASASYDSDRFFSDLGATFDAVGTLNHTNVAPIESFQWRVGGRYYPAQPVRCLFGGSEAYVELSKALDNLGDYTRGGNQSAYRFCAYYNDTNTTTKSEGGEAFVMSCGFENTDVSPGTIAGINAEEQSDIALNIKTRNGATPQQKKLDIFMYYDALLVVRAGNNVELIQ